MALGRNITAAQGETYYRKDDYYLEREGGDEHKLEWTGALASELGLSGKASAEDWKNALHGHFPGGIEIQGGSFKDPETGELQKRAGTDFEFSAPKSFSIQALVHGDDRLIEVHRKAVDAAMGYLEEQVGARRGHAGKNWETTGKALIGRVTHMTSRAGDPQLHDHGVFLNITKNSDGGYQAMTNDRMMNYQRPAQEVYFAELARGCEEIGYVLEKGQYGEPELSGYTREQIEHFSKRLSDVDKYLEEHFGVTRETATPAQKRLAAEHSREAKKARELEGLQKEWEARAREIGAEKIVPGKTRRLSREKRLEIARESLSFAVEHHTERESAVPEGELLRTALAAGRGKIAMEDMKKAVDEAKASGDLIRQAGAGSKQNLMTSREALEREKRILSFEKAGRKKVEPVMNPLRAEAALKAIQEKEGLRLNAEQAAAARMILTTDNRYSGINGYAGVGKTTMLKPAIESLQNGAAFSALTNAGYKVIGLGPQHSAVHALKDAGIIEARTLQSWLADRTAGKSLDVRTVVVIDEAGLTNARDMESAMRRIEKAGARAVLVGDIKQYESVAAGPAFALLQKAGMETVYVTEMQRQNKAPENVKEAARLSVESPEKALEKLEVREIRNPGERYRAMADEYLKSKNPRETLCLTGTHEARKSVNENVREALGLSGKGHGFTRYEAGDFTEAQKKRIDSYEEGQDIRFGKDYRSLGVKAGEIGTVRAVDRENGTVCLRMQDGRDMTMTPREMSGKSHEIGKTLAIELTAGDRIRITGNERKKEGITNGMRGEVIASDHGSLSVRLDNGKSFEMKPGGRPLEIDHGYAQTGHSAQGLGAETVILDLPSNSRTLNRRSFYTNLTRTKGAVTAFTDDRERLTGAVTRESNKTMALDVEKEVREKARERKTRDLSAEQRFGETPEQTKARFERGAIEKKIPEEGKERDQKKEERKEEKGKGQEHTQEKDRSVEQGERRVDPVREEKKEAPRRERERGRDGMGY
ncbi:MAG: relaxase domain-containing protein [Nitrospirae bacterium]|nr:relaxase domain-containing protein [Nitrospirota bacterium]MCL5284218.1 relaxase domain-containing protein [Nitrospirota bacterium]